MSRSRRFTSSFATRWPWPATATLTENSDYCAANATFFEIARAFHSTKNIRLYTDSDGLSEEFERFSGLEFGVLPIPFRSHLLDARSRKGGPLCLAYFGDVRDEKGFHWLPDLVVALMDESRPVETCSVPDTGVARSPGE